MKHLSFKILILCILLPPILYIGTMELVQSLYLDKYLETKLENKIENIYIGDPGKVLEGRVRLEDAVNKNIDHYVDGLTVIRLGIRADISVNTKRGTIVYPSVFKNGNPASSDPSQIAADNFNLMNEGLVTNAELKLDYNTPISGAILFIYLFASLLVFYSHHKSSVKKAELDDLEKEKEIERLRLQETELEDKLVLLEDDRGKISARYSQIKKDMEDAKNRAARNEDDMLEEIENLEGKIEENLALQGEQQKEIDELRNKIALLEKTKKKSRKDSDILQKRFKALYKNVIVHDRALDGFNYLTEELKIKAEEVIHQLNDDSRMVTIKRKVFGKKNRETVLEVLFAYKGRLYFRKLSDNRIEVLAIGTKNTQAKELEFLNNL